MIKITHSCRIQDTLRARRVLLYLPWCPVIHPFRESRHSLSVLVLRGFRAVLEIRSLPYRLSLQAFRFCRAVPALQTLHLPRAVPGAHEDRVDRAVLQDQAGHFLARSELKLREVYEQ